MRTDGGGSLNALLYLVVLACSVRSAGLILAGQQSESTRRQLGILALWLAVAVPSFLQMAWPEVLHALRRDPDLIRADHQWWRLLTAGFVQDGGLLGTAFNLGALAVVAVLARRSWGAGSIWAVFLAGVVGFNALATWGAHSTGAGNSGATFLLATSLTGFVLRRRPGPLASVLTAVTLADGALLLALQDAHGLPIVVGPFVGLLLGYGAGADPVPTREARGAAENRP